MTTKQNVKVTIYSKGYCPYCIRAKRTLKKLGLKFEEFDITFNKAYANKMHKLSKRKTVPQIFINSHHLGGNDDLQTALKNGELKKLIS